MMEIVLTAGESSRARIRPLEGGAVFELLLAGHRVLVSPDGGASPAEFCMAPWPNRIAGGAFVFAGRRISPGADPSLPPLALHGLAWRRPWTLLSSGKGEAEVAFDWRGADVFPFPFRAHRRFRLSPQAFEVDAELVNRGASPMPAALGFHPFFPSRDLILRAPVEGGWETQDHIPVSKGLTAEALTLRDGLALASTVLDHCFYGWGSMAQLVWPDFAVRMKVRPAVSFLQVYAPAGADFACVEPQSAMPDAFNRSSEEGGMRILSPGEAMHLSMRLDIDTGTGCGSSGQRVGDPDE
jgi:aldose 1-epimerase